MNVWPAGASPFRYEQKALHRRWLEREVQNLVGPIVNIAELSTAALYGLRDGALRRRRKGEA